MSNFAQMDEMDDLYKQGDKDSELIPTNVDHKAELSSDFEELFHKQDFSDVIFVVEGERIPCHRVILAMRSEYFRALLYGGLKETTEKEIEIHDANHYTFKNLIKYIYTGKVQLLLTEEQIIDMLGLAHKFFLRDLENDIAAHLRDIISFANFCTIFNVAQMYAISSLIENCLQFADYNAQNILRHETFSDLSIKAVEELAARDSFCAPEIDIFKAVRRWIEADPERIQYGKDLLSKLRLPLIPQKDLLGTVRPSALLSSDDLLDAIHVQQNKRTSELIHRGCKNPDINVACIQYGAKVVRGIAQGLFLSGDFLHNLPECRIHTRHDIGDNEGIVVELGKSFIINTIRLYLPDREQKMYSYYVELSMDDLDWVRVIDYSNIPCRGMQNLVFANRAAKFLRIVGVSNSMANKHFDVTAIEALFSTDTLYRVALPPFDGIVWPSDNVATIEKYATVIEGVSRSRNALLNGHTDGYDWDTGYTCHQVGSGSITVQFPQPYVVNSMRVLLWDCDDRYYSYYVEVSIDNKEWTMVADRKNSQCRSWQLLNFPTCAVVFVRIIGVHNSANEVFHCVHFECPASPVAKLNEECSRYEPPAEFKLETLSVAGPSRQEDN